jgi:hypothetical protein
MRPLNERFGTSSTPELWRNYMREDIPLLFGLTFSAAIWNSGFVNIGQQIFLLVTLDKEDLIQDHRYEEKFLSPDRFRWQSQNRTTQASKHGQMLQHHNERHITVHLFARRSKKIHGRAAPFYYCGPVTFEKWQGNQPITIDWHLNTPIPERLYNLFRITIEKPPTDSGTR